MARFSIAAILVSCLWGPALSDQHYPYAAKVCCGDRVIAQMVFGDSAAATFRERDAIPVFTDVTAMTDFTVPIAQATTTPQFAGCISRSP